MEAYIRQGEMIRNVGSKAKSYMCITGYGFAGFLIAKVVARELFKTIYERTFISGHPPAGRL